MRILFWLAVLVILTSPPASAHEPCCCEQPIYTDPRISGPYVGPDYVPPRHRRHRDCAPPAPTIEYAWPRLGLPK